MPGIKVEAERVGPAPAGRFQGWEHWRASWKAYGRRVTIDPLYLYPKSPAGDRRAILRAGRHHLQRYLDYAKALRSLQRWLDR